jgi:hypothetical protein
VHDLRSPLSLRPASHWTHAEAPSAEIHPGAHPSQRLASAGRNLPAAQAAHSAEPAGDISPAGHLRQAATLAPGALANRPSGQSVHVFARAGAYWPALHAAQSASALPCIAQQRPATVPAGTLHGHDPEHVSGPKQSESWTHTPSPAVQRFAAVQQGPPAEPVGYAQGVGPANACAASRSCMRPGAQSMHSVDAASDHRPASHCTHSV